MVYLLKMVNFYSYVKLPEDMGYQPTMLTKLQRIMQEMVW